MSKRVSSPYFIPLELGALWNIVFGSIGVFALSLHLELFYTDVTAEASYIANSKFWLAVFVAGLGYGVVGFVNYKYRFFITLGALGKILFFLFVSYLWLGGTITVFGICIAICDFVWGLYFLFFIYRTREYGYL